MIYVRIKSKWIMFKLWHANGGKRIAILPFIDDKLELPDTKELLKQYLYNPTFKNFAVI